VDYFFELNPTLIGSFVSFGYFEQFPQNQSTRNPFDLMARFLLRGSAASINNLCPGVDLMIPLVLSDGRISFVGVKAKFNLKKRDVSEMVDKALEQMNFLSMFSEQQSDRPFGLIILIIGEYYYHNVFNRKPKEEKYVSGVNQAPTALVFQGVPEFIKGV